MHDHTSVHKCIHTHTYTCAHSKSPELCVWEPFPRTGSLRMLAWKHVMPPQLSKQSWMESAWILPFISLLTPRWSALFCFNQTAQNGPAGFSSQMQDSPQTNICVQNVLGYSGSQHTQIRGKQECNLSKSTNVLGLKHTYRTSMVLCFFLPES